MPLWRACSPGSPSRRIYLERLFDDQEVHETEEEGTLQSSPSTDLHPLPTADDDQELRAENAAKSDWMDLQGRAPGRRLQERLAQKDLRRLARQQDRPRRHPHDPLQGHYEARLPETHYYVVVDGAKARVILGVLWSPLRRSPKIARCSICSLEERI